MVASITIGNQSMIIATALKTYLVIASTKDNSSTRFNSIFFFLNCCNKWKREISISCRLNQYHWQFIVQINYVRLDITKIFYMQNILWYHGTMVLSTSTHTHINLVDELSLEDVMTKMGKIVRVVTIIQIVRAVTIIWVF